MQKLEEKYNQFILDNSHDFYEAVPFFLNETKNIALAFQNWCQRCCIKFNYKDEKGNSVYTDIARDETTLENDLFNEFINFYYR